MRAVDQPQDIEQAMAETRAEIRQTVEKLSRQAQPERLARIGLAGAGDYTTHLAVREMDHVKAGLHKGSRKLQDALRAYPLWSAGLGLGLAYLLYHHHNTEQKEKF